MPMSVAMAVRPMVHATPLASSRQSIRTAPKSNSMREAPWRCAPAASEDGEDARSDRKVARGLAQPLHRHLVQRAVLLRRGDDLVDLGLQRRLVLRDAHE